MSDKSRGGRKAAKRLARRLKDHADTMSHPGDTARKHPMGFHAPGSFKK